MNKAVLRMLNGLKVRRAKLPKIEGYRDGKFVGEAEEVCIRLLMGDKTNYGYYTGLWDIRYPDGEPVWEWIPEAKGMREANII